MNNDGVHIVGDKQLLKQLQLLHDMGARTNNYRAIFNRASKPMKRAARSNAKNAFKGNAEKRNSKRWNQPRYKKSGKEYKTDKTFGPIWKSISFLTSSRYKGTYWLGPTRGKAKRFDAWYAYFQETGKGFDKEPKLFMQRAYTQYKNIGRLIIKRELYKEIWKVAAKRSSI